MNTQTDKATLRQQALNRRRSMPEHERIAASLSIRRRLIDLLAEQPHASDAALLIYRAMSAEVDTGPLFEPASGLPSPHAFAPVTHHAGSMLWRRVDADTRWQKGDFGVLEPASGSIWSPEAGSAWENACGPAVLICPLVGFDRRGNRLGMGKGCFDRWLAGAKDHILLTIGLAFACQECTEIPAEAHDIPLDVVITEGETIACRSF